MARLPTNRDVTGPQSLQAAALASPHRSGYNERLPNPSLFQKEAL